MPVRVASTNRSWRGSVLAAAIPAIISLSFPSSFAAEHGSVPQFERDVLPILTAHCLKCHGLEARKAGLDLRTPALIGRGGDNGSVLVPGAADESPLYEQIAAGAMPPEGEKKLTDEQAEVIRRWIDAGAPKLQPDQPLTFAEAPAVTEADRQFWAFERPKADPVPEVSNAQRVRNPIDAFLLARLEAKGLNFSADADRVTLVRRASFDLIGLPPTPEEVDAFLSDRSRDAYERLVDRLLASPHFGERWGRHWLDAAGYADVVGSDNDAGILSTGAGKWRYRDYVVRAFNEDKPFDRFLTEQLAGDELVDWRTAERFDDATCGLLVATGFLHTASDDTTAPELNTAVTRYGVIHRTLETVTSNVLGLTVGCARCHTHKFDPIPQRDYYRLMAVFAPALNPQAWLEPEKRALPDVSPAEKARIDGHNAEIDARVKALEDEKAAVRAGVKKRLFADKLNRLPEAIRSDVQTALETAKEKRTEVQVYLAGKLGPQLEITDDQVASALGDEDKAGISEIDRQVAAQNALRRSHGLIHAVYDVGSPSSTYLLRRGNHETPGPEVTPGFLSVLTDRDQTFDFYGSAAQGETTGRRLALARWLTDRDSSAGGLVARARVNRVWQHLFGRGIVATPDNFGRSGSPPSHPALLDWLAVQWRYHDWRLKPLLKEIMTSTAYRQTSRPATESVERAEAIDPDNVLLWRMPLRRLESEIVRDRILAVSGALDRTLGGPAVMTEARADGKVVVDSKKLTSPRDPFRRSLYLLARRNYNLSLLNVFDQPVMTGNCTRRTTSAVVLQSLSLLNDDFVLDQAERFSQRVAGDAGESRTEAIQRAFRLALSRKPVSEEVAWADDLLAGHTGRFQEAGLTEGESQQKALVHLCHMLLCTSEFLYVE